MDFIGRSGQEGPGRAPGNPVHDVKATAVSRKRAKSLRWLRLATVALLFSATILSVAVLISLVLFNNKPESRLVYKDKMQVVVIGEQQVPYFGKIVEINNRYVRLRDIYYFRVTKPIQPENPNQSQDISLVKLGCELHGPFDEMVIRRDSVIFWENLKDDGQVAKAIKTFREQNPGGQKCPEPSANQQSQSTQNQPTAPATTPPANTNTNRR